MSTIKWLLIGTTSVLFFFVLVLGVIFALMPEKEEVTQESKHEQLLEALKTKPGMKEEVVSNLASTVDSLKRDIANYQKLLRRKTEYADSLSKSLSGLQKKAKADSLLQEKRELIASEEELLEKNAKDLAKTYSSMSIKELQPIVRNLDDDTIIRIYKKMNGRTKKNLLTVLPDKRAAEITRYLMKFATN